MSQATGYTCDQCGKFASASDQAKGKVMPRGWMMLVIPNDNGHENAFDLCSNKCVRLKATEREKGERELAPTAPPSPETLPPRQVMVAGRGVDPTQFSNSVRMNHARHHVKNNKVSADCPLCDLETTQ